MRFGIDTNCLIAALTSRRVRLKDEDDLRMVEAAVAADASFIATTDREFLSQRGYGPCEFVTPSEALRRIGV